MDHSQLDISVDSWLVRHVQRSFERAVRQESKLPAEIYTHGHYKDGGLQGMNTPQVRHFLNNVAEIPDVSYFEVGSYLGASVISAAWGNNGTFVAMDNFSWNGGKEEHTRLPLEECMRNNISRFCPEQNIRVINTNCWDYPLNSITDRPVDVYFYDGDHSYEAQKKALTHFINLMAPTFVFIVDDWHESGTTKVKDGTWAGIRQLNLEPLLAIEAPAGDFHQGLGIFVLKKSS